MPPPTALAPDDLNEAERFLVLAVGRGEPADLKRHTVRASVVRDLILEARQGWTVREAGIRIQKAIIDGCLDLEGCEIEKPLLFWHSRLQGGGDRGAMLLRDAKLKRLGIHSCTIEGSIIADRSEIENGHLSRRRAHQGPRANPRLGRGRGARDRGNRDRRRQVGAAGGGHPAHGSAHSAGAPGQG